MPRLDNLGLEALQWIDSGHCLSPFITPFPLGFNLGTHQNKSNRIISHCLPLRLPLRQSVGALPAAKKSKRRPPSQLDTLTAMGALVFGSSVPGRLQPAIPHSSVLGEHSIRAASVCIYP
jgi:hypothetical protein